jgi:hypothetical protein
MRNFVFLIVTLAMAASFATGSSAETHQLGSQSMQTVQAACTSAGGDFRSNIGNFSCTKENCDGKGGSCSVNCGTTTSGDTNCVGTTPRRTAGGSLKLGSVLGTLKGTAVGAGVGKRDPLGSSAAGSAALSQRPLATRTQLNSANSFGIEKSAIAATSSAGGAASTLNNSSKIGASRALR